MAICNAPRCDFNVLQQKVLPVGNMRPFTTQRLFVLFFNDFCCRRFLFTAVMDKPCSVNPDKGKFNLKPTTSSSMLSLCVNGFVCVSICLDCSPQLTVVMFSCGVFYHRINYFEFLSINFHIIQHKLTIDCGGLTPHSWGSVLSVLMLHGPGISTRSTSFHRLNLLAFLL